MRARGLKLPLYMSAAQGGAVAPHAGAWIETHHFFVSQKSSAVAPHAGAWIETE